MGSFWAWMIPIGIIFGGLFVGAVTEKFILPFFLRWAARTSWGLDDLLLQSFRRIVWFWGLLGGFYGALLLAPLRPPLFSLAQKVLLALIIFSVTLVVARISVGLVRFYADKLEAILPTTTLFSNLTSLSIYLLGGLILLQALGISITPLLTALGIGGLAVALALQDTLSNLFAGLHIVASRQVRPGDYVKLESGEEGFVTDITWRNTTIRTWPNNLVIVPNSKLASAIVTNYHLPGREVSVYVTVGVSYDSDLGKVERVTREVAEEILREIPGAVPDYKPWVLYYEFGDYSINFWVILRAKDVISQYTVKHELIKRLHERYRQEGIEIPFPIRTLYFRGEAVSFPPSLHDTVTERGGEPS